jgi:hypothetical protein
VTVVFAFSVTLQVSVLAVVHPVHALKVSLPEAAGAVKVTAVPASYIRVKLAVPFPEPLLSAGVTAIATPVAGSAVFTVSTYDVGGGGVIVVVPPLPPQAVKKRPNPNPRHCAIQHRSSFI